MGNASGVPVAPKPADDAIKAGKVAGARDPNYMTMAGLSDDKVMGQTDEEQQKKLDEIKAGKVAATRDPQYMTLTGLNDADILPTDDKKDDKKDAPPPS